MSSELERGTGISNPLVLLQSMVDKGADPEKLNRFFDLVERWDHNRAVEAFNRAMQACQAEMPVVVRSTVNGRTNKKYAPLETISDRIKPVYTKHGFTLSFSEASGAPEHMARIVCVVRHVGGHEERHQGDYPLDGSGAKGGGVMSPVQGRVSTMTYAKRDLKLAIFDVTIADTDRDGEPLDGGTIGQAECREINRLMGEKHVDAKRFFEWAGVESVEQITRRDCPKVLSMLRAKKAPVNGVAAK